MFELSTAQEMWEKTKQEKYKKEWYNHRSKDIGLYKEL